VTATEYIVLVDEQNREIGQAEKLAAHEKNQLHRAFSVFIFRKAPEIEVLLQQRAADKYHCGGLWTNTCCSHPHPGETILAAGQRRLQDELGFTAPLTDLGWFHYNVHFDNGLSENEIDHVLIGEIDDASLPKPNPTEVQALRWITIEQLETELAAEPTKFTPWLRQALDVIKTA
jgi:isopentenyl-diphosphate delta-isomerase type 1